MSEKQYRGRRKDNGKWVYGHYFHLHNDKMNDGSPERDIHGIFHDSGLTNPVDWEGTIHRAAYVEVIPKTVGQYTGLRDKNSAKIFEGDIVRIPTAFTPKYTFRDARVVYSKASFKYVDCFDWCSFLEWPAPVCLKVIGNVHNNPELVGEK